MSKNQMKNLKLKYITTTITNLISGFDKENIRPSKRDGFWPGRQDGRKYTLRMPARRWDGKRRGEHRRNEGCGVKDWQPSATSPRNTGRGV